MPFEKGHKKATGRPKGVPNKATTEIREKLQEAISGEMKDIKKTLAGIKKENPAQYLTLLEKFMGYIIPKRKDITSDDKPIEPAAPINILVDSSETAETLKKLRNGAEAD